MSSSGAEQGVRRGLGWHGTARARRILLVLALLAASVAPCAAQFGQNKIAYDRFEWKMYPSPHFDVYHYGAESGFLQEVVSDAESAYLRISKELDHELKFRVPLVIYKTHAEFEQTNITMEELTEGILAFAEPIQNRMVIPIDQPPDELYTLIAHELTHIFQFSIFFEGYLGRALRSNPPLWITEGMASYLAQDETNLDRMVIRDAVVNNILPPIQDLRQLTFLTYRYGHAIYDFIEQEQGKEGLRNFIFEYRKVLLTGNVEKAIKEGLGYDVDEFNRRFNRYLRKKYFPVLLEKKAPEDYGKEIGIKKEGVPTFSPTPSPSGELVAVLAAPRRLDIDLMILSAEDGSVLRNLTRGWTNRYEYLVAEVFQGKRDLSWSPTGDQVAVFARKGNTRRLLVYNALTRKLLREIRLPGIAQCASPAFSPDGSRIAFEGNRDGVVDIFELELETGQIRNVTQDDYFDSNPWYAGDGKTLLYDRRIGKFWKVFTVDLSDPQRKSQLTFGPSSDIEPSYSRDGKTVYFSSDRGPYGVFNVYSLDLGTGEIRQYTDVVGGCFSPVEMAERDGSAQLVFATFFEGTFRLFRMPLKQPVASVPATEEVRSEPEIAPFEPPLELTVDAGRITPYRRRWNVEAPYVSVGVADDGTILSNAAVQFTDLLGDHRIQIVASSVSSFANTEVAYVNLKHRTRWGAWVYDYRDFFGAAGGGVFSFQQEQVQRTTGVTSFVQYPLSRYYRIEASLGFVDRSQAFLTQTEQSTPGGGSFVGPNFTRVADRFGLVGASITGDTTRWMDFGPFQGKRFTLGVNYGVNLGADGGGVIPDSLLEGNLLEYLLDFRAYKQLTRRSLLAFRLASLYSAGQRETYTSLGGINQLRGYSFRDFFGSRVAWSNLELRFPLVDQLRFPFGALRSIRGFVFLDVGAAWLKEGLWYDPELGAIRTNPVFGGNPIKFRAWDPEHHRLQDARGSYGFGFQFLFIGGLQFNWAWAQRLPYTRYVPIFDPATLNYNLVPENADTGGRRMEFYIVYDF